MNHIKLIYIFLRIGEVSLISFFTMCLSELLLDKQYGAKRLMRAAFITLNISILFILIGLFMYFRT